MKKLILFFAVIMLASCQINDTTDNSKIIENITYFKDERTKLCFASVNSYSYGSRVITSITCVPCDSLKKIGIK